MPEQKRHYTTGTRDNIKAGARKKQEICQCRRDCREGKHQNKATLSRTGAKKPIKQGERGHTGRATTSEQLRRSHNILFLKCSLVCF